MPRRSKAQRERDLVQIADWLLWEPDLTQTDMAERLDVSQRTISNDISELEERWKQAQTEALDLVKGREAAKLDKVEQEAMQAWERSKEDTKERRHTVKAKAQRSSAGELGQPQPVEVHNVEKTVERIGDPRYLHVVLGAMDRRAELMGLDKLKRIDSGNARRIADALARLQGDDLDERFGHPDEAFEDDALDDEKSE